MKTRLLMLAAAMGALAPAAAAAETQWYGAFDIGAHQPNEIVLTEYGSSTYIDIGLESDWAGFLRAGRRVGEHWRVEAEFGHRPGDFGFTYDLLLGGTDTAEGAVNAQTLMANVLYDFAPDAAFQPFAGAGLGVANVDIELDTFSGDQSSFAWQLIGGGAWRIGGNLTVDATYRYLSTDIESDSVLFNGKQYEDHAFSIGLRHSF